MTKLNQIIAIEKGAKNKAFAEMTEVHHRTLKEKLLSGISRTYQPRDDEGEKLPQESSVVQVRVEDVLRELTATLVRHFDVTASKDATNCVAKADLVVDGRALLAEVPVTYLLFLEKQLVALHTLIAKLPVLDPGEEWSRNASANAWATVPAQTTRTKKVPRSFTKAEATEKHPAQVEMYYEDVVVGNWTTTKFSGALPATRVAELLSRVENLQTAVKMAREAANNTEVVDMAAGKVVFDYLLA